jgi:hypothetical protein
MRSTEKRERALLNASAHAGSQPRPKAQCLLVSTCSYLVRVDTRRMPVFEHDFAINYDL